MRVVIAESYERIHRSNLVGLGVLPLQYRAGESAASLGLDGTETFTVRGLAGGVSPGQQVDVSAVRGDGVGIEFSTLARIDQPAEVEYYRNGGVLQTVVRQLLAGS